MKFIARSRYSVAECDHCPQKKLVWQNIIGLTVTCGDVHHMLAECLGMWTLASQTPPYPEARVKHLIDEGGSHEDESWYYLRNAMENAFQVNLQLTYLSMVLFMSQHTP